MSVERESMVGSSPLHHLLQEADVIVSEHSVADWDGYGADPINKISVDYAREFMRRLFTEELPLPQELTPEPTGYLAMEWMMNGYHIAMSINAESRIEWGGLSPNGRTYGDAEFNKNNNIPEEVAAMLRAVVS